MLILAIDTSGPHCAVALLSDTRVIADVFEPMLKGQAEQLMPMCEDVLADGGCKWGGIDAVAVGVGPGNFTGIRIAVSASRGLALSLGVPAIGVGCLEAQAFGLARPVLSTIDARQNKMFAQVFSDDASEPVMVDIDTLPAVPDPVMCVGFQSAEIAQRLGGAVAEPLAPIAHAIAHIAATRIGTDQPRPAPLYIRAPDAAPPLDTAPAVLDA